MDIQVKPKPTIVIRFRHALNKSGEREKIKGGLRKALVKIGRADIGVVQELCKDVSRETRIRYIGVQANYLIEECTARAVALAEKRGL